MYACLNRMTAGAGLSQEEFVKLSADAGFAGADVDINYGAQHGTSALRDLYAQHNQRPGGWGAPDWRTDPVKAKDGIAQLKTLAPIAAELKIDSCATWLLPSSDLPLMENWKFHVERLRPVAQVLADSGLRFGLEFVAPYHARRGKKHEFIFTAGQMLELANDIGPNVGLLVDSFHLYSSGDAMDSIRQIPKERIVLVHLNDAPNIPLPQLQDGARLLPGDGVIDLKKFLATLRAIGYDGPASVEVFSDALKKMPPAESARKAGIATNNVFKSAGF
ncbi:MAG: sugar phosphate isomerase/epimerase [Anaerolineae bacterium]|nr:sugar phosphate isomerase/epimerase [Phycisphaerae bacterium]